MVLVLLMMMMMISDRLSYLAVGFLLGEWVRYT
jgi:hypothetical protein